MAEQAYWYVVHTYSGYENKVATDLMTMVENRRIQDLICDVKVPTETVMEDQFDKTGNKIGEKEVQRKIYPGYVFVKMVMNDNTWYIVRSTRGSRLCRGRQCRDHFRHNGRFHRYGGRDQSRRTQGPHQDQHVWPRNPGRTWSARSQTSVSGT